MTNPPPQPPGEKAEQPQFTNEEKMTFRVDATYKGQGLWRCAEGLTVGAEVTALSLLAALATH